MNRIVKSERYDATQLNSVFFQWEFSRALNAFTLTQLSAAVRATALIQFVGLLITSGTVIGAVTSAH